MRRKYSYRDLAGMRFGRLLVISRFYPEEMVGDCTFFTCICDCGTTTVVRGHNLINGGTKSCGCLSRSKRGACGIGLTYWNRLLRHSSERGWEFELDPEYVWDLYLRQDGKCAYSGIPLNMNFTTGRNSPGTASLDRIDSTKGYLKGNVQWVRKLVNRMKSDLSEDDFLEWCSRIVQHSKHEE